MQQLIEIINIHFFAFVFAMIAYVYSQILTGHGMILNGLWDYLDRKLPVWLFKPIIDCFLCVAGQMALWSGFYFIDYHRPVFEIISLHTYYICITIFLSVLIDRIYETIKNS